MMEFKTVIDYETLSSPQPALSGILLNLYHRLEKLFLSWAAETDAVEFLFPALIPARALARIDYFRSFPHLVTFPVALDADNANLNQFLQRDPVTPDGTLHLTALSPVQHALTPAACYHFYNHFEGQRLGSPRHLTTRATCFRRESYYVPLERQWNFSMREIVCLGTADEVKAFLARYRDRVDRFFTSSNLPIEWKDATDPFFNPSRNPKYLLQRLDPVKTEMVFQGRLAIGSVNFHRNYFGEAFKIFRNGEEAFSGCVAFGIERWISAILTQFGSNESDWPRLDF